MARRAIVGMVHDDNFMRREGWVPVTGTMIAGDFFGATGPGSEARARSLMPRPTGRGGRPGST